MKEKFETIKEWILDSLACILLSIFCLVFCLIPEDLEDDWYD